MKPYELMTKKQVAAAFSVHRHTVERWVKAGRFPAPVQVFGQPRWKKEDVEDYLAKQSALANGTRSRGWEAKSA